MGKSGLFKDLFADRYVVDNIVMIGAVALINLLNYGYQLAMGIMLTAEDYGTLLGLISLFVIIGVLTQTVTTVLVKTTSTLKADNRTDLIGNLYRLSLKFNFIFGAVLFVVLAALSVLIARFMNFSNPWFVVILFSSFLFAFPLSGNWGILQGLEKFFSLGGNEVLFSLMKLLIAVLFVALGAGVAGGIASLPLSYILTLAFSVMILRHLKTSGSEKVRSPGIGKYAAFTLLTLAALTMLTNVDVVVAKHFLTPVEAGNYSAISVLGRIAFYAPVGIAVVLFPKAARSASSGKEDKRHLFRAVGMSFLIVFVICLIFGLVPGPIIQLLFAGKYQNAAPYLLEYGIGMSLLALAYLGLTYALSIGKRDIAYPILAVMVVQLVLLFTFHGTIASFVNIMVICGGLAVAAIYPSLWLIKNRA